MSVPATYRWLTLDGDEPETTVNVLQREVDDIVWQLDHPRVAQHVDPERQREHRNVLKRQLDDATAALDLALAEEKSRPVVECERCGDPEPCVAVAGEWVCERCAP